MPATPLAEAFVRVRADTSSFKDDVRKGFDDADAHGRGDKAGRDAGRGFSFGFSASLSGLGDVTGKLFDLLASVGKWTALASAVAALGAAAVVTPVAGEIDPDAYASFLADVRVSRIDHEED